MKYHNWPKKTAANHPPAPTSAQAAPNPDNGSRWRFTNTTMAMILAALVALANRSCYVGSIQCSPAPAGNQTNQPQDNIAPTSKT